MEREIPDILRRLAKDLEDPRRIENVEKAELVPSADQKLLLALNKPYSEGEDMHLPDAGQVMKWLQQVILSVETSDQQSAVLGLFYTNLDPLRLNYTRRIAVGIFPRYNDILAYTVKPHVDTRLWSSQGEIRINDGAVAGVDPFLLPNPEPLDPDRQREWRPELVFFNTSPFTPEHPYKTELRKTGYSLARPTLKENALEENVMQRALWYANEGQKPRLFTQDGFRRFVGRNRRDARYIDIYKATKKDFRDTTGNPLARRGAPQFNI